MAQWSVTRPGRARRVQARQAMRVVARRGGARHGRRGMAELGTDGMAGQRRQSMAWQSTAAPGPDRQANSPPLVGATQTP